MPSCDTCGNNYDKSFTVTTFEGDQYVFDSIECAAQKLAPNCSNCGVRILGHGLESDGTYFCCDHCALQAGVTGLNDRV